MALTTADLQRRVGENIRVLRERRGLTEAKAAELLGVDDRYLRRVEAGVFNLKLTSVLRLAGAFDVDPALLLRPRKRPLAKRKPGRPKSRSSPQRRTSGPRPPATAPRKRKTKRKQ